MPPPKLLVRREIPADIGHVFYLARLPTKAATPGEVLPTNLPDRVLWLAVLSRRGLKIGELHKSPLIIDTAQGKRAALALVSDRQSRFDRLTLLRKALQPLIDETPKELAIVDLSSTPSVLDDALLVALLSGAPLPAMKKEPAKNIKRIIVIAPGQEENFATQIALAEANTLARELTALPPNVLTPIEYRRRLVALADEKGWQREEYDFRKLKQLGAGAFCAVAQGSAENDAAIVHLAWRAKSKRKLSRIALVGKGICFDTGGHNLKPAKYMHGMHEDMAGSAVALGLLHAISALDLPVAIDAYLAIARNDLSPNAYAQGDVVRALDGTTIEVVHTDAEGRMVLADTLALAAREKPDLIIDFATLTGSMMTALGARYSGVFASNPALGALAVACGDEAGERLCLFPLDEDYEAALESKVADVKQCTMEGDADHILAARFLKRFVGERAWLHLDLSAARCEGGLGAISSETTGFGVLWGLTFVRRHLAATGQIQE